MSVGAQIHFKLFQNTIPTTLTRIMCRDQTYDGATINKIKCAEEWLGEKLIGIEWYRHYSNT